MRQQVEKQAEQEGLSMDFINLKSSTANPSHKYDEQLEDDVVKLFQPIQGK